jgi:regulatory protein
MDEDQDVDIISDLKRQKRNRRRVSVFLNGEFLFGLNEDTVFRFGLHTGMQLDTRLQAEILRYDQLRQAKLLAERRIASRLRSELELRRYLQEKEIDAAVIDEALGDFRRLGLVDDGEYARAWIRDRMRLKPKSAAFLRKELKLKGIPEQHIENALAESDVDDSAVALQLAEAWMRRHTTLDAASARRRLAGFLQRRGFSASVAMRATDTALSEGHGDASFREDD